MAVAYLSAGATETVKRRVVAGIREMQGESARHIVKACIRQLPTGSALTVSDVSRSSI